MKKIAEFIVKSRKWFALGFLALIIFSVFSYGWVNVEEDMTVYLPETAKAKQGLDRMNEEFITYDSETVMLNDISYDEAKELADEAGAIPGVLMVTFDDTASFYNDGNALLQITYNGTVDDEGIPEATEAVKELFSGYDIYRYNSYDNYYESDMMKDMTHVLIIVVIVVIFVLIFTSTSYVEVLVLLANFIAAAVINMGTNFLMGTISASSNAVAIVLQLALSVDYAIIFCNRYKEEHQTKPINEAISTALAFSVPTILASSLTTIAGLLALTFMEFRLGLDMGIALIKAIVVSMLCVFLLMPFLLSVLGKWIDKTRHKSFVPKVSFLGKFAYKTRFIIPAVFCVLVVFAYFSFSQVSYDYSGFLVQTKKESADTIARREVSACFGDSNTVAVIVPIGDNEKESEFIAELEARPEVISVLSGTNIEALNGYCVADNINYKDLAELAELDEVTAEALFAYHAAEAHEQQDFLDAPTDYRVPVVDLFLTLHDIVNNEEIWEKLGSDLEELNEFSESEEEVTLPDKSVTDDINEMYDSLVMVRRQLLSDDYHCIVLTVDLPYQSDETWAFLEDLYELGESYFGDDVRFTGDIVSVLDFERSFENDNKIVGIISIVLVILVLFFTFKSVAMPILLILVIQGSIWINFASSVWRGSYVFFMCYLIVSAIQMGANIDYAIVVSSRYNEMRDKGIERREAIIETLNLAFPTIITSGTMMVVSGFVIGLNVAETITAGMGSYVGTGTIVTLLLINFVLPQILLFGDAVIRRTSFNIHLKKPAFTPKLKQVLALGLAVVSLAAVICLPLSLAQKKKSSDLMLSGLRSARDSIAPLLELAESYKPDPDESASYSFAKYYVIDAEGSKALKEGQSEYDKGKKEYDEGEKEFNDGKAEYEEGLALYNEMKQQYDTGLAQYYSGQQQYEDGLVQYAEGMEQYEEGLALYNENKALYDAGLEEYNESKALYDAGLEEYNAALEEYNDGLEEYNESKELYDLAQAAYDEVQNYSYYISGLLDEYNQYKQVESEYNAAVEAGDEERANELYETYNSLKSTYETSLPFIGMTVGELYALYEEIPATLADTKAQLEDAEAQLADGEAQLSDAKAQLDDAEAQLADGEAQLTEAEEQLAAGKEELDAAEAQLTDAEQQLSDAKVQLESAAIQLADGKVQLADGKLQLEDAEAQLADGELQLSDAKALLASGKSELDEAKEYIGENAANLSGALDSLNEVTDTRDHLEQGISLLLKEEDLADEIEKDADYKTILNQALKHFNDAIKSAQWDFALRAALLFLFIALAAALLALCALYIERERRSKKNAAEK